MNSEQTNEIAAALAKAQGQMENAKYNKKNPHYGNAYADLAAIIEAVRKPLADNGLSYTQTKTITYAGVDGPTTNLCTLTTTLMHTSGQWISSEYPLPYAPDKPQVMGSALTYGRRYELASICGIAAEEDEDAEIASAAGQQKTAVKRAPPKPAPDVMTAPPHDPQTGEIADDDKITTGVQGISVQDMAHEAAERGTEVLRQFYRSRSKADRAEIEKILPELKDVAAAADAGVSEEGS